MIRNVEREVFQTVVRGGQAVTERRKVLVEESVLEEKALPLRGLQCFVVGDRARDPTKALRPFDPSAVPAILRRSDFAFFFVAGGDPPVS